MDSLAYRMDRMSKRMDKHAERIDMAEHRIFETEDAQNDMGEAQKRMAKLMSSIKDKAEDIEARSRRNNVRILGLAESTPTGTMELFIEKLLIQLLGRETFPDVFVVERTHRLLAAHPPPGAAPRPVIARLLNYRDRDAALRRARELKTLHYKGSELSLFPDFTPLVQEARKKFGPVKRKLRELQLDYAMLYPAKLKVNFDDKPRFYIDPRQLQKDLKQYVANRPAKTPQAMAGGEASAGDGGAREAAGEE